MSDDSPLARLLQQTALAEERCLAGAPCRSNECAVCIFAGDAL